MTQLEQTDYRLTRSNQTQRGGEQTITIDNARLLFKNFSGEARQYNAEGLRNFCVELTEDEARDLQERYGLSARALKQREGDPAPTYILKVSVSYKYKSPTILLISTDANGELRKNAIGEDLVGMLDYISAANIELVINPSHWKSPSGDRRGVKAYLRSLALTIFQDPIEQKYAGVREVEAFPQEAIEGADGQQALPSSPSYDFEGEVVD